jgi:hypothetical protein
MRQIKVIKGLTIYSNEELDFNVATGMQFTISGRFAWNLPVDIEGY